MDTSFPRRILVVRRDNIGDLVCTTPLLAGLRDAFPNAYLCALVNSYNGPVLANQKALDAVYVYTKLKHRERGESVWGPLHDRLKLIHTLRLHRFDTALLARSGFDRHGLNFVRWLRIPRIIGFAPGTGPSPRRLNCPLPQPDNNQLHEVEAVWKLLEPLGIAGAPGPLRLYPDRERVAQRRSSFGEARPVIAVHVSAREASRRLGEDKWKPVIGQLAMALPSARLVLVWSPGTSDDPRHPGDDLMAARLLAMGPRLNLVAAPTAALPDLMAVLAACDLFIGADGGAMHVAAGLGVPTVALFENLPAKLRHWAPWQVPHELVVSPNFAIGDIAPESIVGATLRLIDRGALNP